MLGVPPGVEASRPLARQPWTLLLVMSRLSALHPLSCGGRQRTQNVDASRFPAGSRQGTPGSKYGGLGSAQFLAGRRGQRRSSLRSGLRYDAVASTALNDQPYERGCRGRRHRTMAQGVTSEVPEDRASKVRRVGRLEPKLHSLGVAGQFGQVVESAENARRGRRACQTEPPRAHGATAGYGECPARTSRPWEPLSATASEGL